MSEEENIVNQNAESLNSTAFQEVNSETSVVNEQPLTINNEPTTNMEVHHHPHVEKKKFKEYFLEFVMIFIAVTLGFFAESFREHLVNKGKEKEIISALYSDIKKDTANLNVIIFKYMPEHAAWEDSTELYINTLPLQGNEKKIVKALVNATNWNFYSPPQVSFDVIKNSASFNLIQKKNVKEAVINLNNLINTCINYSQFVLATEHSVDTTAVGIIPRREMQILIANVYMKTNAEYGSITDDDIPKITNLKTYDKARFLNFMSKLDQMDYLLHDLLGLYKKVLVEETNLLNILDKEYHLKDE